MNAKKCFVCDCNIPNGVNFEKNYFCEKHENSLIQLCQTCCEDFDEENCQFCKMEKQQNATEPIKNPQSLPEQQQQQIEFQDNNLTAALILPGLAIILTPLPFFANIVSNIKVCAYSSIQFITSSENNYEIMQTGGIENPQESVASSSLCQRLDIQCYNNAWSLVASDYSFELLTPRYCHTSKKISESIVIIIGGLITSNSYLDSCESIDILNNKVTKIASLNRKRSQCSCCVSNEYLYVFGGFSGIEQQENTIERISLSKLDKWEVVNLQNQESFQYMTGCTMINSIQDSNVVYCFGGSDGIQSNSGIYSFNSQTQSINLILKMNLKRTNNTVKICKHDNSEEFQILGFDENGNISLESFNLKNCMITQEEIQFDENILKICQMFAKDSFVLLN